MFGCRRTMIKDDPDLLRQMLADMADSVERYQPTSYWKEYQDQLLPVIAREGISRFRASESKVFSSFGVTQPPHTLVGEFLEATGTTARSLKGLWLSLVMRSSFYQKCLKQHAVTLKAFRHACFHYAMKGDMEGRLLSISDSGLGAPRDLFSPPEANSQRYTLSFLRYFLYHQWLSERVDLSSVRHLLELGSGYGGQAEVLRKLRPGMKITLCDIPPQLYVCEQYLRSVFPGDVTGYRETREMDRVDLAQTKPITILGTWQIERVVSSFDLFLNCASFQEMEPEVVENYLSVLRPLVTRYIYLIESPDGQKITKRDGTRGVYRKTTLDHYKKFIPDFELICQEDAVVFATGQEGSQYFTSTDVDHMLFKR